MGPDRQFPSDPVRSVKDDLFTVGTPPGANHIEIHNLAYLISGGNPGHESGSKPAVTP